MTRIQVRRGAAATWTGVNPILAAGEPGHETDTGRGKVGDGATAWTALPYTAGPPGVFDVRHYGAKGDGVTDDTAAFSAAVAAANALNLSGTGAAGVVGVTVYVPDGRYRLAGPVTPITRPGVNIKGASDNGSALLLSHDGPTFTWGSATEMPIGGGISNLKVEYPSAPSAAAVVVNAYQASRLRFADLLLVNVGTLLSLGTSAALTASSVHVNDVRGYVHNGGRPVIAARHGAGLHLHAVQLFVGGVDAPAINRTSTMTTVSGTTVVDLTTGTWDTVQITGCFLERFYRGLNLTPPSGAVASNVHIANTYMDYIRDTPIFAAPASGGVVAGITVTGSWLAAWEGDGVALNGPGVVRGVDIGACTLPSAGSHSVKVNAGSDINIHDNLAYGSNRLDVNAMGVALFGGDHLVVRGNQVGRDSAWAGFAWQPYAGIYLVADLDYVTVVDNDVAGAVTPLGMDPNTAGSKNRIVRGNVGASYSGAAAFSLPASGVAWTNTAGTTSDIHIHGGAVTVVSKNGTNVAGMTAGMVTLGPGETLAITYSAAPAVTRFVHP